MNAFNIVQIAKNKLANLFQFELRGTGRTISAIDEAKDGSLIVILESKESENVKRLAKEQGKTVYTVANKDGDLGKVYEQVNGRRFTSVHFDHRFIEKMIERELNFVTHNVESFSGCLTKTDCDTRPTVIRSKLL